MLLTKLNPKKLSANRGEEDEAHDALYDAKLLKRVLDEYSSAFSQRVETCMKDGELLRAEWVFLHGRVDLSPQKVGGGLNII